MKMIHPPGENPQPHPLGEFPPECVRHTDRRGHCALCGGTHYGSLLCPYRCDACVLNTDSCGVETCPRNKRWNEENTSTDFADERRKKRHATTAYAIRMPGGLYFGGFADPRKDPQIKVKWVSGLCDARLFGGNCYAQVEKYVERIKAKDSLYIGPKIVTVEVVP